MKIVVDSSVVIAAAKPGESDHASAVAFFESARNRRDELIVPITALWDIGAALDHPGKTPVGTVFNKVLELELRLLAVDEDLFQRTWHSGKRVPVKGPDRIFISCALDQGAILVSKDDTLVANARAFGVEALRPEELGDV